MKVLLLGPGRTSFISFISSFGDEVAVFQEAPQTDNAFFDADFLVSYGYRHILGKEVLKHFHNRAINLHVSLLPWNRGADPNLWSFLEDTPKGVTVHYIAPGLDTGEIIASREVGWEREDTLSTSYARLTRDIESIFFEAWPEIRALRAKAHPQPRGGSFHRLEDKKPYEPLLKDGWDTPVADLIGKALKKA